MNLENIISGSATGSGMTKIVVPIPVHVSRQFAIRNSAYMPPQPMLINNNKLSSMKAND